jgi:hypothetical protein
VSGIDMSTVVKGQVEGHMWVTGGAYGLEASLTATFLILLGLALVVRYSARLVPRATPAINPGTNGIQPTSDA